MWRRNPTVPGRSSARVYSERRGTQKLPGTVTIQISVYPDRIVFWNPGELPESWTIESLLKKHPSRAFNPAIANAFFRCGEVEAWGRGIGKIVNGAIAEKLLPPVFDTSLGNLKDLFAKPNYNIINELDGSTEPSLF